MKFTHNSTRWMLGLACLVASHSLATGSVADLSRLRLRDASGKPVVLALARSSKALVLLFVSVECPISNGYAPEFRRLREEFTPRQVEFRLVYPNLDESTNVAQHLKEYSLPFSALLDPQHDLVKAAQVHVTPEAAVFVPGRGFVYHGRIDNRYAALGVARPQATERDLHEVLEAILAGKPVPKSGGKAIGCSIAAP